MRIYYRTGIELPAGILRGMLPGHTQRGETSAADLIYLLHIFKLHPVGLAIPQTAIQSRFRSCIDQGIPPIVLGYWISPTTLHWVLGVDYDGFTCTVNDPWDGTRRRYSWDTLTSRYAGWCIV